MIQIVAGTYNGSIFSFVAEPQNLVLTRQIQPSQNSIKSICIVDNQLVGGGFSQQLHVLELPNLREMLDARQNTGTITNILRISENIVAVGVEDGTVRFWDKRIWNIVKEVRVHKKAICDMKVAGNGKVLLSLGGKKLVVWSIAQMRKRHEYKLEYESNLVCVKEDLSTVIIATDRQLKQISTQDNSQVTLFTLELGNKIQSLTLVKDYLLVGTSKGQLKGWILGNYQHTVSFKVHENRIKEVKVVQLNNVQYLITCTSNGQICIWGLEQFLKKIKNNKQDKIVDNITPISSTQIQSRIICLDCRGIQMDAEQSRQLIQQQRIQSVQINEPEEEEERVKVSKKKKIKKQKPKEQEVKVRNKQEKGLKQKKKKKTKQT